MSTHPGRIEQCPNCGCLEVVTEPALDAEGVPTDVLQIICTGCGRVLGELAELEPAAEAEPAEKLHLPAEVDAEEE